MAEDVAVNEKGEAVDYTTMTYDQLLEEVGKAYEAKDMKLMGTLSRLATKAEQVVEKEKKDALLAELTGTTQMVTGEIMKVIDKLGDVGKLTGAEGIWFALDLGAIREKGINPACRLVKSGKKASTGESASQSSYQAGYPPNKEMLAVVGESVMFEEDTLVTIDKAERTVPAGMTFQEAQDLSTNGGWRNRVRMQLGKAYTAAIS